MMARPYTLTASNQEFINYFLTTNRLTPDHVYLICEPPDSRIVYGTMHSDVCPLTSLRGKCQILHRSEIDNLDEYRKGKNCFWFNQIFDRFIRRFYEVVPTWQIINVPDKVKQALDERWKFIAVEINRVKELTAEVKLCKRCTQYCARYE